MRVLPLALMLVAGLLVGFVAGYAVGTRGQTNGAASAAAQPGGAAWSEAKVDPPATPAPAPAPAESPTPASAPQPLSAPVATRGTIVVRSTPNRAGVILDGVWRGRTPLTLSDLTLGRHAVRVAERGYSAENREVTLSAEQGLQELDVRLAATPTSTTGSARPGQAPAPARSRTAPRPPVGEDSTAASGRYMGSLYVDSRPRGARVFVDGRPVGTTPVQLADLAVGSHVVRLELPGHRTWTSPAQVVAGQTARVTGSLEQIP